MSFGLPTTGHALTLPEARAGQEGDLEGSPLPLRGWG